MRFQVQDSGQKYLNGFIVGDNANIVPRKKDKLAADFMPPMLGGFK